MRLRHLFTGELTWRELGVYIAHLPLESATQTLQLADLDEADFEKAVAEHERRHGPWSHTDLLLAAVHDAIERLTFVQLKRAGVKADVPDPLPRPGVRAKVQPINRAAWDYLNTHRAGEGA